MTSPPSESVRGEAMPVLRIDNLRVEREGQTVLAGVNVALGSAERLSIEGAVGSGKSSLLWATLGLIKSEGLIEILGRPCRREDDFLEVRGLAGLLFQDSDEQLIGPSVIEDVMFGPLNRGISHDTSRQRAIEVLTRLGVNDLRHRSVRSLSGGQKRLVALAGILSLQPRLLLLDEPTAGLDAQAASGVIQLLAGMAEPMLLVSHDAECIQTLATRRCRLQAGQLLE